MASHLRLRRASDGSVCVEFLQSELIGIWTRYEIGSRRSFGKDLSISAVWYYLTRLGYTHKKIHSAAAEHNETERIALTTRFSRDYEPPRLVFVDESASDERTMSRRYVWVGSSRPPSGLLDPIHSRRTILALGCFKRRGTVVLEDSA